MVSKWFHLQVGNKFRKSKTRLHWQGEKFSLKTKACLVIFYNAFIKETKNSN